MNSKPVRRAGCLNLEALEERALLSSGRGGPTVPPSLTQPLIAVQGGNSGGNSSSGGPVNVSTPRLAEILPLPGQPGVAIQDLFSGYPLPPGTGPQLTNGLLSTTYVSALPVTLQQSAVAVIPVALTGMSNSTVLSMNPPAGYTVSIITVSGANGPTTSFMVLAYPGTLPTSTPVANPAPVGGN